MVKMRRDVMGSPLDHSGSSYPSLSQPIIILTAHHHRSPLTGGKDQCTELVHCKYIARKWIKYQGCTHPVHPRYIQNFPCQFPCSVPEWLIQRVPLQYICSVPGHVTTVSPFGK